MANNPGNLTDYVLMSETVQLTGNGLNPALGAPYRAINRAGSMPAVPNASDAYGIINDIRDGKATVQTEGIAIVELTNTSSFAVTVGAILRPNTSGVFILGSPAERCMGIALDAETVTSGGPAKYVRIKLITIVV
jgi:hypothetical protein